MDATGYTTGVTIENVSYAGVWNRPLPLELEVPNPKGDSLSSSFVRPPDSPRLTLKINQHLLAERYEEAKILEEFNEAFGGGMEREDSEFLANAKDYRRRKFSAG